VTVAVAVAVVVAVEVVVAVAVAVAVWVAVAVVVAPPQLARMEDSSTTRTNRGSNNFFKFLPPFFITNVEEGFLLI
jgi:hypothetical protein